MSHADGRCIARATATRMICNPPEPVIPPTECREMVCQTDAVPTREMGIQVETRTEYANEATQTEIQNPRRLVDIEGKSEGEQVDILVNELQKDFEFSNFQKVKDGVFQIGAKKLNFKIHNGYLVVRVGGGFMAWDDWVKKFGNKEGIVFKLNEGSGVSIMDGNNFKVLQTKIIERTPSRRSSDASRPEDPPRSLSRTGSKREMNKDEVLNLDKTMKATTRLSLDRHASQELTDKRLSLPASRPSSSASQGSRPPSASSATASPGETRTRKSSVSKTVSSASSTSSPSSSADNTPKLEKRAASRQEKTTQAPPEKKGLPLLKRDKSRTLTM
eukprot:TRINITY_DN8388_c0_g1_i1.p1 TRINITY_DN8388_c0_g1~~TRINITY_DN8388_c0_g1_i1.p1  ORF type:complete len:331 (-),score=81.02 TRINITY_DN8388_c0_g1_i1:72-1064(-)